MAEGGGLGRPSRVRSRRLLGVGTARVGGAHAVHDDVRVAEDGGEQVVEVVGDAASESTHRFHLLRVAEQLLELGPLLQRIVPLRGHRGEHLADNRDQQQEVEGADLSRRRRQAGDRANCKHAGGNRHGGQPSGDQRSA